MKLWILRWLGLVPKENLGSTTAPIPHYAGQLIPELRTRNMFEIIPAVNGKIVVYNRRIDNPSGADRNDLEIYLVHDGDNLMDTVTTAIVSAGLK